MTNEEFLKAVLEERLRTRGEDDSFTRDLRHQLASVQRFKGKARPLQETQTFHIGARGEDLQPGEYQEDMYGNAIPDDRIITLST